MKKGVQYSHYCGTELLEIINAIHLSDHEDKEEAEKWRKYAKEMVSKLRQKISDLDVLNEMSY